MIGVTSEPLAIDYEFDIDRRFLNKAVYEEKFSRAEEYLQTGNISLIRPLLLDPTTFCYLSFMLDDERLKLYPYQDLIINDDHRFKIFRSANQTGKSLLLDAMAARNLVIDHGKSHTEAIVSKSLPQSQYQMRRVKSLLNSSKVFNWKDEKGETDSMSVVSYDIKEDVLDSNGNPVKDYKTGLVKQRVKYTNLLVCAPCTEGLLGYPCDELNLDEFEYWDVDIKFFFNQIALPRTYKTKGRITIFSNPNGFSFVSELEQQHNLDGSRKWHVYVFNYLDCPGNTKEEYDQLKADLPRQQFESTVAAIRSLADRAYFTYKEIEASKDERLSERDMVGKQPIFFLDVGAKHDQCWLTGGFVEPDPDNPSFVHIYTPILHEYPVGYPISRVVGTDVDESDGWHSEKSIKDYFYEWSASGAIPIVGFDATGNPGMKALLESVGIPAEDVTFSGPSKSGYYQRFKYFMEKGLLHRPPNSTWESQAQELEVTKSVRGYLLINSASTTSGGGGKGALREAARMKRKPDDAMDSMAGFIAIADPQDFTPASLKII